MKLCSLAALIVLLALSGCLTAPPINIIDTKTSLEQQAAGDYPQLERELVEAGVQPGPVPLTREQIAQSAPAGSSPDEASEASDAQRVDALLVRLCLGEALDGKLAVTASTCTGDPDEQEVAHLMERSNRSRQQTWTYLGTLHPNARPEAVRAAWRATRLRELVCGGQVQAADGSWEAKKC
jgi:hypothetical protein